MTDTAPVPVYPHVEQRDGAYLVRPDAHTTIQCSDYHVDQQHGGESSVVTFFVDGGEEIVGQSTDAELVHIFADESFGRRTRDEPLPDHLHDG